MENLLDVRTLAVVITLTTALLTLAAWLFVRSVGRDREAGLLPLANLLVFLGFLGLMTQGRIHGSISVLAANALVTASFYLYSRVFARYWKAPFSWGLLIGSLVIQTMVLAWFTFVQESVGARIAVTSFIHLIFVLRAVLVGAPPGAPPALGRIQRASQVLFAITALFFLFRLWAAFYYSPTDLFSSGLATGLTFLVVNILAVGWNLTYFLLTVTAVNQRLQESLDQKDRLFAIIGHDLKGPLSSFHSLAELLGMGACHDEETLNRLIKEITEVSKNMNSLLDSLLLWGRSQSQDALKLGPVNLKGICSETAVYFRHGISQKQITLKVEVSDDLTVLGESASIRTILRNLVSNALKYTPVGGTIILAASQDRTKTLSVRDSGIGMDTQMVMNLFTPGEVRSHPGTDGEKGNGFGLLICKELAERCGCRLGVSSMQGRGTTFTLEFQG